MWDTTCWGVVDEVDKVDKVDKVDGVDKVDKVDKGVAICYLMFFSR